MSNASSRRPLRVLRSATPKPSLSSGEVKKRWPGVVLAILLTAAVFIIGATLGSLVISLLVSLTKQPGAQETTLFGSAVLLQFAYATAVYGSMTAVLLWVLRWRRLNVGDLGFIKWPRWGDLVWAIVAFLSYMSLYVILLSVLKPLVPGLDTDQRQDIGFDGASGLSLVLVFCALAIIAPLAEELLMRGFLFTTLRRKMKFWLTALITSIVFASLHLTGGESGAGLLWIAAVDTFILSIVLCYLREKTGRLWSGIAVHMIKNSVAFLMLFIVGSAG